MLRLKTSLLFLYLQLSASIMWGQTGPAGVGMHNGTSALKLWLDAGKGTYQDTAQRISSSDGSKVMFWKDLSGSNNHVMVAKDSNSPTLVAVNPSMNNQSALRFYFNAPANKKTYLASDTFSSTNDITIYCVFHALSRGGGNNISPFKTTGYHPNMWYYGAGLVDAGAGKFTNDVSLTFCDTSIAAGAGDLTTETDYCIKTPASINQSYFATLQKEAWNGTLSVSKNAGTPSRMQAGAQPINKAPRYFIGSTSNLNSLYDTTYFNGYIASVLVYNCLLTTIEKILLENYLSAKYNIPMAQNDFYPFDDLSAGNFDEDIAGVGIANDGSIQKTAKGEGIVEISLAGEAGRNTFAFIGHDGKSLQMDSNHLPEGLAEKMQRNWIYSQKGLLENIDLTIDAIMLPNITKEDVVLMVDTDNNGDYSNETFGKGIIPISQVTNSGNFCFRGLNLQHGNRFTFGRLKSACKNDCEVYFTPNNDGIDDIFYLSVSGKTSIFDRSGKLIKSLATPAYWDGSNEEGEISPPGIYFLISNEEVQQTLTLIR